MGFRRAAKGTKDFLVEAVGEAVGEAILTLLACALLAGLALLTHVSWSYSPRLTLAGAGLLSLFLAHGAWAAFRDPRKGRRRTITTVAMTGFTLTAATAVLLLFYATGCDCL
ncbi:lysine transporter LysE [Streptomyces griseobrunneus]|uniref:lysine transporter LysE n=1 Tax=Streptomyces microflavus TaxID=1919 RepID=UPI0038224A8E